MTFSTMTFSITTLSIMAHSIMTFSITILNIMDLIVTLGTNDTHLNNTQHNDTLVLC